MPLNPCGKIVDFIRSAYETQMQFGDLPESRCLVRWYFVPPDRPALGIMSPFISRNWDKDEGDYPDLPLGEVRGSARTWRDGSAPSANYSGAGLCGAVNEWEHGIGAALPLARAAAPDGFPGCCDPPFALKIGAGTRGPEGSGIIVGAGSSPPLSASIVAGGRAGELHSGMGDAGLLASAAAPEQRQPGILAAGAAPLPRPAGALVGAGLRTPLGRAGAACGGGSAPQFVPACMPTLIQQGTYSALNVSISVTFNKPTIAGSLLTAVVAASNTAPPAPVINCPLGWLSGPQTEFENFACGVFYYPRAPAMINTGNFYHYATGFIMTMIAGEWRNFSLALPLDQEGTASGNTLSAVVSHPGPTAQDCELGIVGAGIHPDYPPSAPPGTGWALSGYALGIGNVSSVSAVQYTRKLSPAGNYPFAITFPIATRWALNLATFRSP